MKAGDISNKMAPSIGMRFEGILYQTGKLNRAAKAFLENVTGSTINVYLLTSMDDRKVKAFCYKYAIPYTQIIQIDSAFEIPEICQAHELAVYYDIDEKVLETVGNRGRVRTKAERWTMEEHY